MKIREQDESQTQLSTICRQLKLMSSDGKNYKTDCSNTEGIFRIIQSVSSPKAELFKRWLAKVGYERIQEIEDPELATKRTRAIYKAKINWWVPILNGCCGTVFFALCVRTYPSLTLP